jgi:2-oxoglutarate ferredoxin oxidoreductase subunit gamma
VSHIVQVRLCGFGGQGIVLAGLLLGEAGAHEGKYVAGASSYGAQARGSGCKSDIVFSGNPITFPHLTAIDILMAMSQTSYEEHAYGVDAKGVIVYDQFQVKPGNDVGVRHVGVPATEYAIKTLHNKQAANVVLLGALVELTGIVSSDGLAKAIEKHVGERFRTQNLCALRAGRELAGQLHG